VTESIFFFEKKKQKTFNSGTGSTMRALAGNNPPRPPQ
jgi:hypothetical protein